MNPFVSDPDFILYVGDALGVLRGLPDESVHCVATSPPFYALRDYGVEGQIGLEATPTCGAHGLMRLRSDLTEAQREYVVRRLLDADGPDA